MKIVGSRSIASLVSRSSRDQNLNITGLAQALVILVISEVFTRLDEDQALTV